MNKYLDKDGLAHFKGKIEDLINKNSSGMRINVLETICENVELTSENKIHSFSPSISIDTVGLYLLTYSLFDSEIGTENFCIISSAESEPSSVGYNIEWLGGDIVMTSETVTDTSLTNANQRSTITIEKIEIVHTSAKDLLNDSLLMNVSNGCVASGRRTYAEGLNTTASGNNSHAEGYSTKASGIYSHAEGASTTASETASHAEGAITKASGNYSHAEGYSTTASETASHAEGASTKASGNYSHAEGASTKASGNYSHAEGYSTTASGAVSHAGGISTIASAYGQTAIGYYNKEYAGANTNSKNTNAIFLIGMGSSESTRSNAFRVGHAGVFGSTYYSSGADYAEFFEWVEENQNGEEKVGRFVTLDGDKIRLATYEDEFVLGVVSGNPSIIGDSHEDQWKDMYMHDIYGRLIYEDVEVPETYDELGNTVSEAHVERLPKLNPDYDDTKTYIPRSNRSEWSPVGMMGKLVVEDDGTCEVNGYCYPFENGIATTSGVPTKYRVMKRIDEKHIKVMIL